MTDSCAAALNGSGTALITVSSLKHLSQCMRPRRLNSISVIKNGIVFIHAKTEKVKREIKCRLSTELIILKERSAGRKTMTLLLIVK